MVVWHYLENTEKSTLNSMHFESKDSVGKGSSIFFMAYHRLCFILTLYEGTPSIPVLYMDLKN